MLQGLSPGEDNSFAVSIPFFFVTLHSILANVQIRSRENRSCLLPHNHVPSKENNMIMDTNKTNDLYLSRVLYLSATKIFCGEKQQHLKCA